MLSKRHALRGFTIVELMVVVAVFAVLLFSVAPSVIVWNSNTQVRNTASAILSGLQVARNESIRRNAVVRFSLVSLTNPAVMDNTCALSGSGTSWVVSVRDPVGACGATPVTFANNDPADSNSYPNAVADATNPLIVQTNAGGVGGRNVVVEGKLLDGSAAAHTVAFNGLGRVENAGPIGFINVRNRTQGNDYRNLRIEISTGGSARLCDLAVTTDTDSRFCPTRGIS